MTGHQRRAGDRVGAKRRGHEPDRKPVGTCCLKPANHRRSVGVVSPGVDIHDRLEHRRGREVRNRRVIAHSRLGKAAVAAHLRGVTFANHNWDKPGHLWGWQDDREQQPDDLGEASLLGVEIGQFRRAEAFLGSGVDGIDVVDQAVENRIVLRRLEETALLVSGSDNPADVVLRQVRIRLEVTLADQPKDPLAVGVPRPVGFLHPHIPDRALRA